MEKEYLSDNFEDWKNDLLDLKKQAVTKNSGQFRKDLVIPFLVGSIVTR